MNQDSSQTNQLALPLQASSFAAIDFESAGATRGQTDVPIQIGMAWMEGTGTIPHHRFFRSFLSTTSPIALAARQVHGITPQDLLGAPTLPSLWPEIHSRLQSRILVAHHRGTERKFLRAFPGHPFGPWLDTLPLARMFYPHAASHSLGDLLVSLDLLEQVETLCPDLYWHDALFDAVASLVLLRHMIQAAHLEQHSVASLLQMDLRAYQAFRTPKNR